MRAKHAIHNSVLCGQSRHHWDLFTRKGCHHVAPVEFFCSVSVQNAIAVGDGTQVRVWARKLIHADVTQSANCSLTKIHSSSLPPTNSSAVDKRGDTSPRTHQHSTLSRHCISRDAYLELTLWVEVNINSCLNRKDASGDELTRASFQNPRNHPWHAPSWPPFRVCRGWGRRG